MGASVPLAFEVGKDGHGMTVAQLEILFQPLYDLAGFYLGIEYAFDEELFLFGQFLEIFGRLACLGLDIIHVSLE